MGTDENLTVVYKQCLLSIIINVCISLGHFGFAVPTYKLACVSSLIILFYSFFYYYYGLFFVVHIYYS